MALPGGTDIGSSRASWEPDPIEQEGIRLARKLRAEGRTLAQIAAQLEAAGYPAAGGGRWYPTTVKRLITARNRPDPGIQRTVTGES